MRAVLVRHGGDYDHDPRVRPPWRRHSALSTTLWRDGNSVCEDACGTKVDDGHGGSFQGGGGAFVYGVNTPPVIAAGSTSTAALSVDPTHATGDSETVADIFGRLMPASLASNSAYNCASWESI